MTPVVTCLPSNLLKVADLTTPWVRPEPPHNTPRTAHTSTTQPPTVDAMALIRLETIYRTSSPVWPPLMIEDDRSKSMQPGKRLSTDAGRSLGAGDRFLCRGTRLQTTSLSPKLRKALMQCHSHTRTTYEANILGPLNGTAAKPPSLPTQRNVRVASMLCFVGFGFSFMEKKTGII